MTYGAECVPTRKQHMYKMSVTDMRMLTSIQLGQGFDVANLNMVRTVLS